MAVEFHWGTATMILVTATFTKCHGGHGCRRRFGGDTWRLGNGPGRPIDSSFDRELKISRRECRKKSSLKEDSERVQEKRRTGLSGGGENAGRVMVRSDAM